jgi:uncharacterized protein
MKAKNIILLLIIIVIVVIVYNSFDAGDNDPAYISQIEDDRKETDRFMRNNDQSPFGENKKSFTALKYFPPDTRYRIVADLTPITDKKMIVLGTSDGKEQRLIEYAYAEFKLDGIKNKLLILESVEIGPTRGSLFLAFGDKTSGNETYGGGRYLDVKKVPGSSTITLDFNKAYNPYCAYNDTYSCPLPPRENLLEVAIKAGEKNYKSY